VHTAISTVLNNPHKSQAPPKAHSSLPSVPPASLPRIRRKDFDSYLRNIAPEWERFQKNAELGREGVAQLEAEGSSSLFASDDGTSPPPTPSTSRHLAGGLIKGKPLPPLESVPDVFFESDFDLSDPKTFDAIIEGSSLEDMSLSATSSDPDTDADTIPLVERLSQHADTIEQHLVREISVRSTSFFAALANLQDLQTESAACLERIGRLRGLLREVDEGSAKRGLEIVRRHAQKRNLARVGEGVGMIAEVVDMTGVARKFVSSGRWNEALGVLSEIESRWDVLESTNGAGSAAKQSHRRMVSKDLPILPREGRLSPIVDSPIEMSPASPLPLPTTDTQRIVGQPTTASLPLSSLQAFGSLPSHLQDLTLEIATALALEVVDVLRTDLHERIGSSIPSDKLDNMLRERLRPLLHGLLRTNHIQQAALSWREVVTNEIRVVISKVNLFS
jgi:vacuolar protein sorting-associated protein 54